MNYLLKNILIALIITLVIGSGYYFFIGKNTEIVEPFQTDISLTVKQQTEKILLDTQRVNEFSLDNSIFSDARFVNLINTRTELKEIPTGRSNPFETLN